MLNQEIKELYSLGFAVHLLLPRSKRPIAERWQKGPRAKWSELEKAFKPGMNIGVRLGRASEIDGKFLAVVDCDVKSTNSKDLAEMLSALNGFLPGTAIPAPRVASGRGNGSAHFYVLTDRPATPRRLAQSPKKVKVHMPSIAPSRIEKETLTAEELRKGMRLRAAWEISLMGEKQQVVLPPSIHPDSGKAYRWEKKIEAVDSLPVLKLAQVEGETEKADYDTSDFKAVKVDLIASNLDAETVAEIMDGDGVGDRSGALLGVCNQMLRAGMRDNEILSVLTDPENFLGQVAYEHAQTDSRKRAAHWIGKYTLAKAKDDRSSAKYFDEHVEVTLTSDQVKKQMKEIESEETWTDLIERDKSGKPSITLKNTIMVLQGAVGEKVFQRDEFANADLYGMNTPWGGKKGEELRDIDTVRVKKWFAHAWGFEPSDDRIIQAMSAIADINRFHPVRLWLEGLPEWDGTERASTWLKRLCRADATEPYLSAVSRKVLTALIARVYEPGCKFENILILEGAQGLGKSRLACALAGREWFTDATIDVHDKDSVLTMQSKWIVEFGEIVSVRKNDVEAMKAFLSRETDRMRAPYGRRTENFPRQCVFIGTTNDSHYLSDPTGERRYWPVKVGFCDVEGLSAEREQLFAEALVLYQTGETLYLDDSEDRRRKEETSKRTFQDVWETQLDDWFRKQRKEKNGTAIDPNRFKIADLVSDFGPWHGRELSRGDQLRLADVLRRLGYENIVQWSKESKRIERYWVKNLTPREIS